MNIKHLLISLAVIIFCVSCKSPKEVAYFQDTTANTITQIPDKRLITIQPEDRNSIIVNSKDPQLASLFNLLKANQSIGMKSTGNSGQGDVLGYIVDSEGYIDFPVLGKIKVEGLTREEIAKLIKDELISKNLVKDPIVTVDYMNLFVSVLGEVNSPGKYYLDKDCTTLLDVISQAGDLTIYGQRENIKVLRNENGEQKVYVVNLCSNNELMNSPAYYLQQNDIVYVEPNKVRAGQSTVNDNNLRSITFWMSMASFLMTLGVLIFK